jgi:hypothetical protein
MAGSQPLLQVVADYTRVSAVHAAVTQVRASVRRNILELLVELDVVVPGVLVGGAAKRNPVSRR